MDQSAAHKIVASQGWLSEMPASFRRAVLERCLLKQFEAGEPIFSIGDAPGGMFGMVAGSIGVSIAPRGQGPYTAHFAAPGSWFGEVSAFTHQPRRVGLIATRDTELLHLPLRAIDEIVRRNPSAWRLFAVITIGYLDLAMGAADDLMMRNHVKRLVAVLLRLGDCRYVSPTDRGPIEVDVNHEDLAHMANVARTTAGSTLRKLEKDGLVALSYRRVSILAPDALRRKLRD